MDELLIGLDPDGDQLLGFWSGGNEFLYQSDHLNLPGASVSVTVFMAGVLERLALILPNRTLAKEYDTRARYMGSEVMRLLWLPGKGRFASLRDFQNYTQTARVLYYTDLAFPSLYGASLLPANATYHTLLSVDSSNLWMPPDDSCPYPRLRVGNMLPTLFGNNVPSVVAMAEMSEALLQGYRIDKGIGLLEAVAATASTRSNAPGDVMVRDLWIVGSCSCEFEQVFLNKWCLRWIGVCISRWSRVRGWPVQQSAGRSSAGHHPWSFWFKPWNREGQRHCSSLEPCSSRSARSIAEGGRNPDVSHRLPSHPKPNSLQGLTHIWFPAQEVGPTRLCA